MSNVRIVLVGPKFEGNIGAVCRSMANFGLDDLVLVNPCEIGDDAYRRAKHGSGVLDNARIVDTIREAIDGCFLIVGTSGVTTGGDKNYTRIPLPAKEFAERVKDYPEKMAILFGREDVGLLQDELEKCDLLVTVPTDETYPILNLSHAATIVMYEMFNGGLHEAEEADPEEKNRIYEFFDKLMVAADYPEHRREMTSVMFRRMMGRAIPTKYEYNTIMGVFGDSVKKIEKMDKKLKENDIDLY